jgi:hypothetical protein
LEQAAMVQNHIRTLRSRRLFSGVPIVFVAENQTGYAHTRLEESVQTLLNVSVLHQNGGDKAGVAKTQLMTSDYVIVVNDILTRKMVFWDKNWFTTTGRRLPNGTTDGEGMLDELCQEILRYCYDENGKLTGKINGMQDDLYVAFAMLCYWSRAVERPGNMNPYASLR